MKKGNLYIMISAAVLGLFVGCMENTNSDSDAGKRALDDTASNISDSVENEKVTTTEELTPLETFARITAVARKESTTHETCVTESEIVDSTDNTENRSEWFSKHELFDIEAADEQERSETWYRFSKDEETTSTIVDN